MHSISESESGRLMAQWRATGGAIETGAVEAAGDDGLSASPSRGNLCHVVDDGLKAVQFTTDMHPYARCSGDEALAGGRFTGICLDDGLAAVQFTVASGGGICADDGLQAGSPTGFHIPGVCGDDGLSATGPSINRWCGAPAGGGLAV